MPFIEAAQSNKFDRNSLKEACSVAVRKCNLENLTASYVVATSKGYQIVKRRDVAPMQAAMRCTPDGECTRGVEGLDL